MKKRPNVIFILTDDQGYAPLGCHGHPLVKTPALDQLYAESSRFTQFHVGPTCAPTRAGLLTGHHANSTGVWHTIGGRSLLRKDEWTLPQALRDSGYITSLFGKWHLGDEYPYRPHDRGFDYALYHGGGGVGQTPDYWGNDYFDDTYFVNGKPVRFTGYCTDVFFSQAWKFIEENQEKPFFCFISANAPHEPLNVEPEYRDLYSGLTGNDNYARFLGMITNIDDNVAKLRKRLKESGLEENTVLIFMSDNGQAKLDLDDSSWHNAGMRGYKGSPYDGGHRVPFFIHWPKGEIPENYDIDQVTSYVDFMPTILELCSVKIPPERSFHGESLVDLLREKDDQRWNERCVVTDSQRLPYPVKWRNSCVMKNSWRLVNHDELYNITNDPSQEENIAEAHPGLVREMRKAYEGWWEIVLLQYDEDIPFYIGGDKKSIKLTSHDLRNDKCDVAWNQKFIRQGKICRGYWEIFVETNGAYEFELRRWPNETEHLLTSGIDGDDVEFRRDAVVPYEVERYTGGTALPVKMAFLRIGGNDVLEKSIDAADSGVKFKVDLQSGPARLEACFSDHGKLLLSAYYVIIRKLV